MESSPCGIVLRPVWFHFPKNVCKMWLLDICGRLNWALYIFEAFFYFESLFLGIKPCVVWRTWGRFELSKGLIEIKEGISVEGRTRAGTLGRSADCWSAVCSSLGPVITSFRNVGARLFLCVTRQVANGVIFFIEGENYILKSTDWAREVGTVRRMLFALFGLCCKMSPWR